MNRDHVRGVAELSDASITRKADMAPSKGTTYETEAKYGETVLQAEEAFFELDASGLGGGEDLVNEVEGFGWDHGASFTGNPPEAVVQLRIVSS